MKITKQITTKEEIEITLPYFTRSICHWYKVISEETAIQVLSVEDRICGNLTLVNRSLALGYRHEICSEEEFNEKFDIVLNQFKKIVK